MDYISIVVSFLAALMILTSVIFVLFKDWEKQFNRYYLFYAISGFGIIFTMFLTFLFPESPYLTQINRVTQASTMMFLGSLFTLSLVFPGTENNFPLKISVFILTPATIVTILIVFSDISITNAYFKDGMIQREYKSFYGITDFYNIYAAMAFIYLLSGTMVFIIKYIKMDIYIYRLQMRYVFVGASLAITTATFCSIILPKFFDYSRLYAIGPSIAALFTILSLFYSIITYNLMDIKTVIHKTTIYTILSMIIFLPIFGILYLYYNKLYIFEILPTFIVASIIVIIFIMFKFYIQPIIDKLFKRKQYEFEKIIDNFIRDAESIKDLTSIIKISVKNLYDSLYLKTAFFVLYNSDSRNYELSYREGKTLNQNLFPIGKNAPIIRWFVRNQNLLTLNRIYTDDKISSEIRDDLSAFYNNHSLQLILPLYHERRLLGLLCLGEKDSLSPFSPDELEKLNYFLSRSNEFISTALSYRKAMEEKFIERTVDLSSTLMKRSNPESLPNINNIKFGAFLMPKYSDGGCDYFDFLRPGPHGVGIIATDISGVGINSALYSVLIRTAFHSNLFDAPSTYTVMQNINRVLYNYTNGKSGLVTAFYLFYDIKSMRLMYTNAGYPALEVFRVEKNNFDSLDTEGIPLGYDPTSSYGIGRTNLLRGDIGVLYTKTLINSKNQKGEEFGIGRLRKIINENRIHHPSEIANIVKETYNDFLGLSAPESDVLVLLFKIV